MNETFEGVRDLGEVISCGMRRVCPACKKGKMFGTYFKMNATCPVCGVRYEREPGEYVVAMYINLITTELLFLAGYLLTSSYTNWDTWTQIGVWGTFNIAFPLWFYPRSKALWAAGLALGGGLYRD